LILLENGYFSFFLDCIELVWPCSDDFRQNAFRSEGRQPYPVSPGGKRREEEEGEKPGAAAFDNRSFRLFMLARGVDPVYSGS